MRDWNDPKYREFRRLVRKRDNHKCQWPHCNQKKRLQVHHILPYSKYPILKYNPNNGITLCRQHHSLIKNKEEHYTNLFTMIVNRNQKWK